MDTTAFEVVPEDQVVGDISTIDLSSLFHRPWEEYEFVIRFSPWQRCQHGKQIVEVMAHWSDDKPGPPVTTGRKNSTQRFPRTVHLDGSAHSPEHPDETFCYPTVNYCGKCRALNSLERRQEAYGDRVTCRNCHNENWYSIGD